MFLKRTAAAILGGAILCSGAAFAANLAPQKTEQTTADAVVSTDATAQQAPEIMAERELYYGTIKELIQDEQTGTITGLYLESESAGEYVFHIDEATLLLDSGAGTRTLVNTLKVGQGVYVFHSPVATMSLPPQSYAEAIVTNIPADAGCAMLKTVEAVKTNEDGSVTVTTDRGGLNLTIEKDAQYGDYNGRQVMGVDDLRVGTRIFVRYNTVQESYPAQASTKNVVVAPAKEQEGMKISVNGTDLEATAKVQNGTLMVPASAVAKALGLSTSYANTAEGEQVKVFNDKTSMVMDIGSDTYLVGDMVLSYGTPAVIEEGTTWMPAQALADLTDTQLSLATGAVSFTAAQAE